RHLQGADAAVQPGGDLPLDEDDRGAPPVTTRVQTARRPMLAALPRFSQQINRVAQWIVVGLFGVWIVGNVLSAPQQVLSVLLLGITYGAIYALVALGYTLVYGIIELINFAHGDVFMLGTMVTITVANGWLGLNGTQAWYTTIPELLLTLAAAMAFCGGLNVAIERVAYRPLRNAPKLAPLITASGASIFPTNTLFSVGGFPYREKSLLVVLITIPVLLALSYLVRNTKPGK